MNKSLWFFTYVHNLYTHRATGLDGPGSYPGGGNSVSSFSKTSRLALESTQSPVQSVLGFLPEDKVAGA